MRPALCIAVLALALCSCKSIRDAAGDFSISLGTPLGTVTVESKLAKDTANAVLGPVVDPVTNAVGIEAAPAPGK